MPSAGGDSPTVTHYGVYGLQNCEDGRCISQIVEIVVSAGVIIWLLFEFIMQIKVRMRLDFSWREVMLTLIFLCLSFNICFMAWADVILWYVLQCLMYQFYFTTLVYYFTKKYIEKISDDEGRRYYFIPLLVGYAMFCLGELGIFIFMVNAGLSHCKEIAELVVNAVMICLAILFSILAYKNEREERLKFEEFKVDSQVKDPLGTIWVWVLANTLGQILNQIESGLIYDQYRGQDCYPIQQSLEIEILGPLFMVLTEAVPFCSTLWFYSQRRKHIEERISCLTQLQLAQSQIDVDNQVQLIRESSRGVKSGLSQSLI